MKNKKKNPKNLKKVKKAFAGSICWHYISHTKYLLKPWHALMNNNMQAQQ